MQTSLGRECRWLLGPWCRQSPEIQPQPQAFRDTADLRGGSSFFFLIPKTFCFGLQLINNVVIVPVKRLSHIYTCIHSPPNPREGLLNGGELGALRTAWIWADFILIGFSPRNKINNAKQREMGKQGKFQMQSRHSLDQGSADLFPERAR